MGFFSNLGNASAATHLAGTLDEFVLPSFQELRQRGLRQELRAALKSGLADARSAMARASTKGQLSIAESMLGKMLSRRKDDLILSSTYSLIGIYAASRTRARLHPNFSVEFEMIAERAWETINDVGGLDVIDELLALDRILGVTN